MAEYVEFPFATTFSRVSETWPKQYLRGPLPSRNCQPTFNRYNQTIGASYNRTGFSRFNFDLNKTEYFSRSVQTNALGTATYLWDTEKRQPYLESWEIDSAVDPTWDVEAPPVVAGRRAALPPRLVKDGEVKGTLLGPNHEPDDYDTLISEGVFTARLSAIKSSALGILITEPSPSFHAQEIIPVLAWSESFTSWDSVALEYVHDQVAYEAARDAQVDGYTDSKNDAQDAADTLQAQINALDVTTYPGYRTAAEYASDAETARASSQAYNEELSANYPATPEAEIEDAPAPAIGKGAQFSQIPQRTKDRDALLLAEQKAWKDAMVSMYGDLIAALQGGDVGILVSEGNAPSAHLRSITRRRKRRFWLHDKIVPEGKKLTINFSYNQVPDIGSEETVTVITDTVTADADDLFAEQDWEVLEPQEDGSADPSVDTRLLLLDANPDVFAVDSCVAKFGMFGYLPPEEEGDPPRIFRREDYTGGWPGCEDEGPREYTGVRRYGVSWQFPNMAQFTFNADFREAFRALGKGFVVGNTIFQNSPGLSPVTRLAVGFHQSHLFLAPEETETTRTWFRRTIICEDGEVETTDELTSELTDEITTAALLEASETLQGEDDYEAFGSIFKSGLAGWSIDWLPDHELFYLHQKIGYFFNFNVASGTTISLNYDREVRNLVTGQTTITKDVLLELTTPLDGFEELQAEENTMERRTNWRVVAPFVVPTFGGVGTRVNSASLADAI